MAIDKTTAEKMLKLFSKNLHSPAGLIPFHDMFSDDIKHLNAGLESIVDEQGFPQPCSLDLLRSLLICWTQMQYIADQQNIPLFSADNQRRLKEVVLQCLRLTRPNGSAVFSPVYSSKSELNAIVKPFIELLKYVFLYDTDSNDRQISEQIFQQYHSLSLESNPLSFPHSSEPGIDIGEFSKGVTESSCFASRHRIAILRKSWDPSSPALYLATDFGNKNGFDQKKYPSSFVKIMEEYGQNLTERQKSATLNTSSPDLQTEFFWKKKMLFCGNWKTSIHINRQELHPTDKWHVLCQDIDSNYAYMEWELPLSENYRMERLVLMTFKEDIILFADSILPNKAKREEEVEIQYETIFPLCKDLTFGTLSDAMELTTFPSSDKKAIKYPRMTIIPPALSEWRSTDNQQTFIQQDSELLLRRNVRGKALFTPLLFNLNESRAKKACTWRHLTVGENREVVPDDRAVGYRIQLGNEQYIIYRSLDENKCRTLLGHHLNSEFMFASFDPKFGVNSIIEVEYN